MHIGATLEGGVFWGLLSAVCAEPQSTNQRSLGEEGRERQSSGVEQHKQRHRGMKEFGVLATREHRVGVRE